MRSKAVLFGHPLHPMLIPFPVAFLTGSVVFDVAARLRDSPAMWTTGGHLLSAGIIAALAAAIPGLIDYIFTVPPRSSGKTRATRHMAANLTAVVLFALAWSFRATQVASPAGLVMMLEVAALALLGAGAYMGGTLVTRNLISVDHRYAHAGKWQDVTPEGGTGGPIVVARRDELKVDQMKLLRIQGKRVVVARTSDGYVAFDDRCTHRGGSLAGGVMVCGTVQCLWHGSQFEGATGKVKAGPATTGVTVYDVQESGNEVTLRLR
jgi:nitrite reductase/ring-hydroxylating ferredoxin subunit/uncharacterized membrane protein